MIKLRLIFVGTLIIFLSGCQTHPGSIIRTQKFMSFEIVEINGKRYIDPELSFCLEREYKFSLEFLGPTEKFRNVPIEQCNKITGYGPLEYVDVYNFLEDVRQEILKHER